MIRPVLLLIVCSLLILIPISSGDELSNTTPPAASPGDGNQSLPDPDETLMDGNATLMNLSANATAYDASLSPNLTVNGTNATVRPSQTPVYTLSIGSVYESDYTEPQPRTFSYSGCGAS
jgi:hypothetical protein